MCTCHKILIQTLTLTHCARAPDPITLFILYMFSCLYKYQQFGKVWKTFTLGNLLYLADLTFVSASTLTLNFTVSLLSKLHKKPWMPGKSVCDFVCYLFIVFLKFFIYSVKYLYFWGSNYKIPWRRRNLKVQQLKKQTSWLFCFGAPAASFSLTSHADHYTSAHIPQN